jgi:hypothetical protein
MLYFYKESDKALIFTTEILKKEVELPNGKVVKVTAQGADVKFAMVAKGDQDWGEFQAGDKVPLRCSDAKVILENDKEADNLYWATY